MDLNSRVIEVSVPVPRNSGRFKTGKNPGTPYTENQGSAFYATQSSREKRGKFDCAEIERLTTLTLMRLPCYSHTQHKLQAQHQWQQYCHLLRLENSELGEE